MRYTRYDRKYYRGFEKNYEAEYGSSGTSGPGDTALLTNILTAVLIALVVAIVIGTAVALTQKNRSVHNYRHADPSPQKVINMSARSNSKVDAYTNIGQLRVLTRAPSEDTEGSVVVLSPWFSYPQDDTGLFEELSRKERQTKNIISEYFALYTKDQLLQKGEKQIKEDLLAHINEQLVLGKIRAIYFDQYLFFE